eukprot:TRINITY_DN13559_c0_g1_i1.p1 TRINITY_DN13559_c0_g1~~TRINITY_DN13559_c0_g1_i1.p1  ORF type:complete len:287 (-),score=35.24 TRINITY_DN13559_c0_g1_i1:70-930(-)
MGAKFDSVVHVCGIVGKHWAYNCATFLLCVIFILGFISFFMPWYHNDFEGVYMFDKDATDGVTENINVNGHIDEYYFHLEMEASFTNLTGHTVLDKSISCDYMDGDCDIENLRTYFTNIDDWDLTEYQHFYGASFAFLLMSLLIVIAMVPLVQILHWKHAQFSRTLNLVFFFILLGLAITLFFFLAVAWSVHLGHPGYVRKSFDVADNDCRSYSHDQAGVLCSWKGSFKVSDKYKRTLVFFGHQDVTDYSEKWEPTTGWKLNTVNLGLAIYILILIVGWRPSTSEI